MDETVFTASVDGRTPVVVRLTGELDLAGVPLLHSALEGLDGDVALDCSGLEFIDAAGLTGLVWAHEACAARGSKLVLLDPSAAVDRLLHLVELDTVLSIRRERESY